MTFLASGRRKPAISPIGGSIIRSAKNEVASGEWDQFNESGTGTQVARITSWGAETPASAFRGSSGLKHKAGPTVSAGDPIARANWFSPPGAILETNPLVTIGDIVWMGGAYFFRSTDPHDYTAFMRLSDNNSGHPDCVLQLTYQSSSGNMEARLEDYGGGGASGVPDVSYRSGIFLPKDQWVFIEYGIRCHNDVSQGWHELWINDAQVGSRVINRTIKTAAMEYRRVHHGLGNYHASVAGRTATIYTDHCYLANGRLGSAWS